MMLSRVILYGSPWTRAFRNVWMLEELGISYENNEVMPFSAEAKEHVRSGKIPILLEYDNIDDPKPSFVLYESSAINTYLGDKYGGIDMKLIPAPSTRERAIYDQTVSCIMTELDAQSLWIHRKHVAMGKVFGDIPEVATGARENFTRMNKQLSKQLNPFVLGENFTAADILYIHCLDWSKSIGWHTDWPQSIEPYRKLCQQRPAYLAAKAKRDVGKDIRRKDRDVGKSSL
jgi:glutathione S-transferase